MLPFICNGFAGVLPAPEYLSCVDSLSILFVSVCFQFNHINHNISLEIALPENASSVKRTNVNVNPGFFFRSQDIHT